MTSIAIVETATGGIFTLNNAFMLGMDHLVYNGDSVYEIQEGDKIRFSGQAA